MHKVTARLLRVNTLNSSGYFMYHPVITLKKFAFYPQSIFLCFVKDTGTIGDYFPTQHQQTGFTTECVYCAVRTESSNIILVQIKSPKHAVITGPPPRRLGLDPRLVHVRYMTK
jgi:hypothetical protein